MLSYPFCVPNVQAERLALTVIIAAVRQRGSSSCRTDLSIVNRNYCTAGETTLNCLGGILLGAVYLPSIRGLGAGSRQLGRLLPAGKRKGRSRATGTAECHGPGIRRAAWPGGGNAGRGCRPPPSGLTLPSRIGRPIWCMWIPASRVTGRIRGRDFAPERAELGNGVLMLRQGQDFFPELAMEVSLFLTEGQTIEGAKYRVPPGQDFEAPMVTVQWREQDQGVPESETVMNHHAMILEFGTKQAGKIPGRIDLSLPDEQRSFVAGTFVAVLEGDTSEPGTGEIAGRITLKGSAPQGWVSVECLGKNAEGELECAGGTLVAATWFGPQQGPVGRSRPAASRQYRRHPQAQSQQQGIA